MPLDAETEPGPGIPDRLDGAVGGGGAHLQTRAEAVDGLVVVRVDAEQVGVREPVQQRAGSDADGVRRRERARGLAVVEGGEVGQMLVQRAAARHVERLHPAADGEHRQIALGRAGEHRQLVLVAHAVDVGPEQRVRGVAVDAGVDVGPAAEDQAVEAVEQRGGVVDEAVGRHHDRDPARLLDRLRVRQPQREALRRKVTLPASGGERPGGLGVGAQLVRDDADQRRSTGDGGTGAGDA